MDQISNLNQNTKNKILKKVFSSNEKRKKLKNLKEIINDEVEKDFQYSVKKSKIDFILFHHKLESPKDILDKYSAFFNQERLEIRRNDIFKDFESRKEFVRSTKAIQMVTIKIISLWIKLEK